MAPVQLDDDAITRVMGSSEDNWTKSTALGTGIAVVGVAMRRLVESRQVSEACREVMDQHALLRAQVVENAKGKLCFRVPASPVTPVVEVLLWPGRESDHVISGNIVISDDEGSLGAALNKVIRDEMNSPFLSSEKKASSPLNLFEVHLYTETSRAQTILALRFHSGGLDRSSALTVTQQFFTALNAIVDGDSPCLATNPGKDALLPPIEDLVPKGKASKNFLQKGLDTVGYALGASKYPMLPFQPSFTEQRKEPFRTDIISYTLGKAGTAELLAACKEENTTLAAALTAACLKTASNLKEVKDKKKDEFNFTSLVDCRFHFEPNLHKSVMGNYVAGIPQTQQVKEGVSFWELARSLSTGTAKDLSKYRQFSEIPVLNMLFAQVLKHPNVTPSSSLRTTLFSMFVDECPKSEWKDVEKLQVAAVCGPFPSMHGVGPCFAISETFIDGCDLSLTFIYPQPVYLRSQMEAFANSVLEHLNVASRR